MAVEKLRGGRLAATVASAVVFKALLISIAFKRFNPRGGIAATASDLYDPRIMLTLPIWIVTEHIQPSNPESIPEKPGGALAFSSAEKIFKFMKSNLGGEWKMQMADDRDGLVILIADLHRLEIATLVLDPDTTGTGGEQIALADLVNFADSLR